MEYSILDIAKLYQRQYPDKIVIIAYETIDKLLFLDTIQDVVCRIYKGIKPSYGDNEIKVEGRRYLFIDHEVFTKVRDLISPNRDITISQNGKDYTFENISDAITMIHPFDKATVAFSPDVLISDDYYIVTIDREDKIITYTTKGICKKYVIKESFDTLTAEVESYLLKFSEYSTLL